jgi:hypothetical protein
MHVGFYVEGFDHEIEFPEHLKKNILENKIISSKNHEHHKKKVLSTNL